MSITITNVLLTMSHVTLKHCTGLNPSTLLPTAQDGEPHPCLEVVDAVSKPRDALFDINPDSVIFVEGYALRNPTDGSPCVFYAICTTHANSLITCLLRQLNICQ